MKEKILVVGHKNPDSDSICSAIVYANLKEKLGLDTKPVRLGKINKETEFILNYFGVETPELIETIKPQLKDLRKGVKDVIREEDSLRKVIKLMTEKNYSSLAVVDSENRLKSMLHISEIADAYLEMGAIDIFKNYETTFENLWQALGKEASLVNGIYPKGIIRGNLRGVSELSKIKKGDIVITTLLSKNINNAEKAGAELIIICVDETDVIPDCNVKIPIVRVNNGIFKVFKRISESVPIKSILSDSKFIHFYTNDYIDDVEEIIDNSEQNNFPVVDENGKVVSTIRLKHIMNIEKNEVILVDHNEAPQSIDGIETAKILEIVDHHKFGNFETIEPLMIRAEPVGATSTVIYGLYKEAKIIPSKKMAGLMLSAILSDTLIFKSPTCTQKDINYAKELAKIADIDIESYGMKMLIAGTSLGDITPSEIINIDKKEFSMGKFNVAVAQVNSVDVEGVLEKRDELKKVINDEILEKNYDMFLFMITDIIRNGSKIVALGKAKELVTKGFNIELVEDEAWLDGVVSRKKQIIPFLMDASQMI
ncbi:putative manganese-dependent inorganic diphosphatase [Haliovirga abyssi]|uniref:inorganic diphosphatase n=1 Tax=Haliovirga abyssi TaxID=2996794 RepID=A0AAU9DBV8_9FUSO|nr:putative manganese-dependent inorganic diphosphatase [Haliovirga abyssi]BDU49757.1 manganese-dependent inorganic pyrophosphatase [Haliovirga abyssi]